MDQPVGHAKVHKNQNYEVFLGQLSAQYLGARLNSVKNVLFVKQFWHFFVT